MKRNLNGKIPNTIRDSKGHLYMAEYNDQMKGMVIPDSQVVRENNGQWFTHDKVENFVVKSTPRCPTYGVCDHCFASGPVHMLCQKCKMKGQRYIIAKKNGRILDVEWVSRFFRTSHLDVRADRTQNWMTQQIWIVSGIQLQVYTQCRWPAGKLLRKEDPKYWYKCIWNYLKMASVPMVQEYGTQLRTKSRF
jgi:hypothetical protein